MSSEMQQNSVEAVSSSLLTAWLCCCTSSPVVLTQSTVISQPDSLVWFTVQTQNCQHRWKGGMEQTGIKCMLELGLLGKVMALNTLSYTDTYLSIYCTSHLKPCVYDDNLGCVIEMFILRQN